MYSYLYRNKKYSLLVCRKRPMPLGIDVSLQNIPWTDWSYGLSVRGMFCLVYISIEVGLERKACCMILWDQVSQGMDLLRHCYKNIQTFLMIFLVKVVISGKYKNLNKITKI